MPYSLLGCSLHKVTKRDPVLRNQVSPNVLTAIVAVATAISLLGALLPWARLETIFFGQLTVSGTNGDGQLVIGATITNALLLLWLFLSNSRLAGTLSLLLGLGVSLIGLYHIVNVQNLIGDQELSALASVGEGLFLVLLGGVVWAVTTLLIVFQRPKTQSDSIEEIDNRSEVSGS